MSPARKEHSNDFRELVIKHHLNGDLEREIASKMLCSRNTIHSMTTKYKKKTRCIANLTGRGRKRKTTTRVEKLIQQKIKVDRRQSASSVQHEIMDKLKISTRPVKQFVVVLMYLDCMDMLLGKSLM